MVSSEVKAVLFSLGFGIFSVLIAAGLKQIFADADMMGLEPLIFGVLFNFALGVLVIVNRPSMVDFLSFRVWMLRLWLLCSAGGALLFSIGMIGGIG